MTLTKSTTFGKIARTLLDEDVNEDLMSLITDEYGSARRVMHLEREALRKQSIRSKWTCDRNQQRCYFRVRMSTTKKTSITVMFRVPFAELMKERKKEESFGTLCFLYRDILGLLLSGMFPFVIFSFPFSYSLACSVRSPGKYRQRHRRDFKTSIEKPPSED